MLCAVLVFIVAHTNSEGMHFFFTNTVKSFVEMTTHLLFSYCTACRSSIGDRLGHCVIQVSSGIMTDETVQRLKPQ